jgi:hypothetical protein
MHHKSMNNLWLSRPTSSLWLSAALMVPSLAFAQKPEGETAKVGYLLSYRSALSGYEAYKEQSVQPWKAANDKVGEIGGWRAYAKEIKSGQPGSAKDAAPVTDPHSGHHGGEKP